MNKTDITQGMKYTLKEISGYLKARGIPKQMIDQIRMQLTYDAVTQRDNIQYDRIYAAIALSLREAYGFGPQRILKCLKAFDEVVGRAGDEESDWTELMEKLRDETGIIIRSGDDDRLVVEVLTDEEKENYKYGDKK